MEQAIRQFERYIQSRYPNSTTAKNYKHDLQQFSQLIDKPPRAVTREDVDRFVEDQLERGLTATTVNRRLAALHEFFEYMAAESQETDWPNPVNWKRHKVKPSKRLPRDVSEPVIERLFAQITLARDKAMFRLMLDVGLRVEEVAKLRASDMLLASDGSSARLRVQGKGDKERFVWLMPEMLHILQAWLEQRAGAAAEAMFITRRNQGFSVRGIQERLGYYCQLAGIKVSPHQLRHTFGRRMAEARLPVTSLAALLGHAQVTTTQIYIAGAGVDVQADYRDAIERLNAACLDDSPPSSDGAASLPHATEASDVWALAGAKPTSPAVSQPALELDLSCYWEGLPNWLTERLEAYLGYWQRRWKPSQVQHHTMTRLYSLRGVWRWLLDEEQISSLAELKRVHVQNYVEARLSAEVNQATVNRNLTNLWGFLSYCQERGDMICPSVFRVPRPKQGNTLPRFLTESDYRRLERQVLQATQAGQRDDLLDRTWFYLLSEAGLRISEVRDLRLRDVDLAAQRLTVREDKTKRDRTVPLSPTLLAALKVYLPVRGEAQTDHVLIYREQAVNNSLIQSRLQRYGQQAQVEVSPHRLRHTLATRLLNEGMPITSLQRLLGHEQLNTTLIYARVHDETVRRDYERAQARLTPASSLADKLFNAPTEVAEPQPASAESNCV